VSATLHAENPANSLEKHCYCHLQGRQFGHGKSMLYADLSTGIGNGDGD